MPSYFRTHAQRAFSAMPNHSMPPTSWIGRAKQRRTSVLEHNIEDAKMEDRAFRVHGTRVASRVA